MQLFLFFKGYMRGEINKGDDIIYKSELILEGFEKEKGKFLHLKRERTEKTDEYNKLLNAISYIIAAIA